MVHKRQQSGQPQLSKTDVHSAHWHIPRVHSWRCTESINYGMQLCHDVPQWFMAVGQKLLVGGLISFKSTSTWKTWSASFYCSTVGQISNRKKLVIQGLHNQMPLRQHVKPNLLRIQGRALACVVEIKAVRLWSDINHCTRTRSPHDCVAVFGTATGSLRCCCCWR